jgi:outer membrane protein
MSTRVLQLLLLALAFCLSLDAFTLQEALKNALISYPGLKAEYQDVTIAAARVDFARSYYRPTILSRGDAGDLRIYDSFTDTKTKLYPKIVEANITQPLYRGGRTVSGIRRAKHVFLSEKYFYCDERDALLVDTATRYIDALREQEVLKANQNNQEYLARELKAVQDRFDVGDVTETDLYQSKARLAGADARVTESLGRKSVALAELEKLTGQRGDDLTFPEYLSQLPTSQEDLTLLVLQQNRQLKAQEEIYLAAAQAFLEVRGELYPELHFEGRIIHTKDLLIRGEFSNEISSFLHLTIPLYQAGRVYARLREAAAVVRKEKWLYEELYLDLRKRSVQAWEAWITSKSQMESFEFQIKANKVALAGVKLEESAGLRTVLDILNAELEVLNATVEYINARRNKFVSELAIFQLLSAVYSQFFPCYSETN